MPFDFSNKAQEPSDQSGTQGNDASIEDNHDLGIDPEVVPEIADDLHLDPVLRPFIPNAYDTPPGVLSPDTAKESFAQGAVIVALNDLEDGDELFCDYRLNPNLKNLPSWYIPVDESRDAILWG